MPGMNTGLEGIRRRFDTSIFTQYSLSNGVPVWMQEKSPIALHDVGILEVCFPGIGSIQDPHGQEGIAHFFEHIPFRGTAQLPNTLAILCPLEEETAAWGATTSTYWTRYYIATLQDEMRLAVDTTFELSTCPLIRDEDVAIECGPIGNEYLTQLCGNSQRWTELHYRQAVFGDHPCVHSALGTPDTIQNMTGDLLRQFQEEHYHTSNMTLICGGAFSERGDALDILEEKFGKLPRSSRCASAIPQIPIPKKQIVDLTDAAYGNDRIIFTWVMKRSHDDKQLSAFKLLAGVLSGRMSSPLVVALRLNLGILYSARLSFFDVTPDVQIFEVQMPVAARHFAIAEETLFNSLTQLSEAEILKGQRICQKQRKKIFYDGVNVCLTQTPDELVRYGRPLSFEEVEIIQDNIELQEVFDCRNLLLNSDYVVGKMRIK